MIASRPRLRFLLTFATLTVLALGVSCSGCGQETPEQQAERVRAALSDNGVSGINVSVGDDGRVAVSGTVASDEERARIAGLVDGLDGMAGAWENRIEVVPPEPEISEEERLAQERASACRSALDAASSSNVLFATSSSSLDRGARSLLDGVIEAAGSCDEYSLSLRGHADPRGEQDYNQGLSERRAASVKDYLVGEGLSGDSISTAGFGETRSLGGSLEEDRRVEIVVGG